MAVLEKRVDYLESAMADLARSQILSDTRFRDFVDEMSDFKDEMKDFKDVVLDFKDEMKNFKMK
jgi:tRNA A58 N-methylase Trm61